MRSIQTAGIVLLVVTAGLFAAEPDSLIHVHADKTIGKISPYTIGACIEDVNHEIYGGLYSQMVFGESFQEPAPVASPPGFTAYAGSWLVQNGEVAAGAGEGPKLIHNQTRFGDGVVSVEIQFADRNAGNGGLILRVDQPGVGADRFTGYEIALHPDHQNLLLGRHRQNWEMIRLVPCPVPLNEWISLSVQMKDRKINIKVNGQELLEYEDHEHPLAAGQIGLRTWQREAQFRKLQVTSGDRTEQIPFVESSKSVDVVSGMWRAVRNGKCQGELKLASAGFIGNQSQRISMTGGDGEVGVENRGLNRWGMNFIADRPYEGSVWAKADHATKLRVAFEDHAGASTLAETQLTVKTGDWQRLEFALTPTKSDPSGCLVLSLKQPGSVALGHVFLQQGEWGRFKNLPVRWDVSEALTKTGLTVLRYGGSMVNCADYRWKQMIGPRDRRPQYKGTWYSHSTNGWGIIDFLNFCEAEGFLSIPDLSIDESPQDMADFVEYINGPADSTWGKRRVADGHPAPYKLKYIQLGNEEAVNEVYLQKFKPLADAIWKVDPDIIPVVGDFAYRQKIEDPYNFPGAPTIKSLAAHKEILDFAKQRGKPVWFDIHIWNDGLRDADLQIEVLSGLIEWFGKLSPGANFRVCVFEENANNHLWRRGLAHARTVNRLQRFCDKVPIVCLANCLQPDGQNDNGWDQGMVFLSPSNVWLQSTAYVTQMMSKNQLPLCVSTDCQGPNDTLDVTTRMSEDGRILALQIANIDSVPRTTRLKFSGVNLRGRVAKISQIMGHLEDRNTETDPNRIVPSEREWRPIIEGDTVIYTFPPYSFSVLRFE